MGDYLVVTVYPNGNPNQHHLYYMDLKKYGEIVGKLPLKPVYTTDFSSQFDVSEK